MDRYERAALRRANKIRRELGKRPLKRLPKGVAGGDSCPLALATGCWVTPGVARFKARRYERTWSHPLLVHEFIARFDGGGYEHLHV